MPARPFALRFALGLLLLALMATGARSQGLAQHDPAQPIEILADRLVVEQAREVAVFTGNVEAVQGTLKLRADRLEVFYRLSGEGGTPSGQPVRRIVAEGNVVIASPEESAQAERAVYEVLEGRIRLDGGVVLASGENVIRGERLDIDLNRRQAVVSASPETGGRVRALFVPGEGLRLGGGKGSQP